MTAFISLMALSERRTRKEKPRLAISKEIFNSLCRRAQQYSVKPSRLAEDVIEHYLAEMQRALFGQVGADKVLPVPAEARAIDAIIFAMEGVLFDSVTFQRVAAIQMFSEDWQVHGRVEDFPSMAEIPREASISRFAGKCHIDGFDLVRAKQGVEERYVEKYCVPGVLPSVDGAFNLVARLRKLGLKTAILTEASTEVVSASMEAVGFSNNLPFDEVSSRDGSHKSVKECLATIAKNLGVEPRRCASVEFLPERVQAAASLGMRAIALTGQASHEQLLDFGASLVRDCVGAITLEDVLGKQLGEFRVIALPDDA